MVARDSRHRSSRSQLFVNIRKIANRDDSPQYSGKTGIEVSDQNHLEWQKIFSDTALISGYNPVRLAELCAISLRQLERQFKAVFSCAPRVWLKEQRMAAASQLLEKSCSIKEVAYALSYKQPSHFTREFKSHFGVTPSQFREQEPKRPSTGNRSPLLTVREPVESHS